ncbi:hypothetical protein [Sphingomonas sp. SORGH_AS_0438]|uniref:hypothetical protein n=1 Tax=Sphingomonas sp. SORGH_AS_0438 TaxID=3041756 RepID=UPI002863F4BD|nr:hypothetical protein [Sphingomonas sp. SORGH_AS_0438]MDR6128027.1 hypothetical protein [Sphingomonas sp. SORGH_AS_0438]
MGWFVVAKQADRREFRKEIREQFKELRGSIDEVRTRAETYWLHEDPSKSAPDATALSSEIRRLARYTRNLEQAGLKFNSIPLIVQVRSLATGGDFQSRSRQRSDADQDRLDDLSGALEDVLSAADDAFYSEFHATKPRRWLRWIPLIGAFFLTTD